MVELAGGRDDRAEHGEPRSRFERGRYLWPGSAELLREAGLMPPNPAERRDLTVSGWTLRVEAVRGDLVWFDFADRYPRWVLSGLTSLTSRDAAQRFANVIDVLCDRDLPLTLIGGRPLSELPLASRPALLQAITKQELRKWPGLTYAT